MTMAELRKWVADNGEIPDETKITVNVYGMSGNGEWQFVYYKTSPFNTFAYIWVEDAN